MSTGDRWISGCHQPVCKTLEVPTTLPPFRPTNQPSGTCGGSSVFRWSAMKFNAFAANFAPKISSQNLNGLYFWRSFKPPKPPKNKQGQSTNQNKGHLGFRIDFLKKNISMTICERTSFCCLIFWANASTPRYCLLVAYQEPGKSAFSCPLWDDENGWKGDQPNVWGRSRGHGLTWDPIEKEALEKSVRCRFNL